MTIEAFSQFLSQDEHNAAVLRRLQDKTLASQADSMPPWDYDPGQWY